MAKAFFTYFAKKYTKFSQKLGKNSITDIITTFFTSATNSNGIDFIKKNDCWGYLWCNIVFLH